MRRILVKTKTLLSTRLFRVAPVLLPLLILIGSGLRGLDFGVHWDEKGYQIAAIETMVKTGILLPQYYGYPSFNYWVGLAGLMPDLGAALLAKGNIQKQELKVKEQVLKAVEGYPYLMRLRTIFLVITSLSVLWVYILVLKWRQSWIEALLAGSFLALSWEVAYHLRWIATDGMLMQFGALTLLFTVFSRIQPDGHTWLRFAAIAAGLGFGTKYPGALLLVPVLVAGYLTWDKKQLPLRRLLIKLTIIFTAAYLITTPATVLQPTRFLADVLYEVLNHYSRGHAGHTVSPGLEHGWRMLIYLSSVLFSPYTPIAFLFFILSIIGGYALTKESPKTASLFLCFPILYLLYFCTQRAMIVRNLLVVAPFMAICAARGTNFLWKYLKLKGNTKTSDGGLKLNLLQAGYAIVVVISLLVNAGWLVYAAETIVDRNTDRYVHEASSYILAEKDKRFFLSPLTRLKLAVAGSIQFANVTDDPTKADQVVFYVSEGMEHWQDWPANRPRLTKTWFGPYEVNFNMYPNWWGDDRIVVMAMAQAKEIGILLLPIANNGSNNRSPNNGSPSEKPGHAILHAIRTAFPQTYPLEINQSRISWELPHVDPCTLLTRTETEAVMGPLRDGSTLKGSALDGTSCTYINSKPFIVRISIISTAAFELQRYNPGNTTINDLGDKAYITKPNSFKDVYLFVRKGGAAIMVNVFTGEGDNLETKKYQIAKEMADKALDRLLIVMRQQI